MLNIEGGFNDECDCMVTCLNNFSSTCFLFGNTILGCREHTIDVTWGALIFACRA